MSDKLTGTAEHAFEWLAKQGSKNVADVPDLMARYVTQVLADRLRGSQVAGTAEKIAAEWMSDDLADATEGRDTFYHCEECKEIVTAHCVAAITEALAAQAEREKVLFLQKQELSCQLDAVRRRAEAAEERERAVREALQWVVENSVDALAVAKAKAALLKGE